MQALHQGFFFFRVTEPGLVQLPRRLFGGCLVMSSMSKVMMMGGFDGDRGDFADGIEEFSLRTNAWLTGNRVLNKGELTYHGRKCYFLELMSTFFEQEGTITPARRRGSGAGRSSS